MYLIDTNVISEARKQGKANPGVTAFFSQVADQEEALYLSVLSVGELRRGVELIRYRGALQQASLLESADGLTALHPSRQRCSDAPPTAGRSSGALSLGGRRRIGQDGAMHSHFHDMAAYTAWANRRIYSDAGSLPEELLHRDVGIYFKSLFATLAHILQTDRAWTYLLQGGALQQMKLPPVPTRFAELHAARQHQDAAFVDWISGLDADWLARPYTFVSGLASWSGKTYHGTHASTLSHVLNHQTHHRGQAHAALTLLGVAEPQALDMVVKGFLGE